MTTWKPEGAPAVLAMLVEVIEEAAEGGSSSEFDG